MIRIVVFFPSWRYFGHFALPLFEPLVEEFEVIFLHTEKAIYGWNDCPDLSEKKIQTVDLKDLKTYSFIVALEKLAPDRVVIFDKGWAQDRAVLHATRKLRIPSFHIQHGMIAKLDQVKTKNTLRRATNEFIKIIKTFRLYNTTLFQVGTKAWLKSLLFQLRLIQNPNNYYYNFRHEITADYAGIIGERDRSFFLEKEGYTEEQLVPMGALQFERAYALDPLPAKETRLLLISQPLFEDHLLEGGLSAKEKHIREIINASPIPLAVKPHPREDRSWYSEHFSSSELEVFPEEMDINQAILKSSYVIGYFSTALINALILKRQIGIIRWVDDRAYVLNLDKDAAALTLPHPDSLKKLETSIVKTGSSFYAYPSSPHKVLREIMKKSV